MEKALLVIRLLSGLMLVVFGLNKFLDFIPMEGPGGQAGLMMMALVHSGYIMSMVAVVEIVVGIAFLLNKFVALGAVVLMPVALNAFMFHLMLEPKGIAASAFLLLFTLIIMFSQRKNYMPLFKA